MSNSKFIKCVFRYFTVDWDSFKSHPREKPAFCNGLQAKIAEVHWT